MLYNDAYRPILGQKHPRALGQVGAECWPEIWDLIGPMLNGVLAGGEATWSADQLLVLERNGFPEECFFTFSYSPIFDESGGVGGVFTAVTETTERVIGERRLRTLANLAESITDLRDVDEIVAQAVRQLAADARDNAVRRDRVDYGGWRVVAPRSGRRVARRRIGTSDPRSVALASQGDSGGRCMAPGERLPDAAVGGAGGAARRDRRGRFATAPSVWPECASRRRCCLSRIRYVRQPPGWESFFPSPARKPPSGRG